MSERRLGAAMDLRFDEAVEEFADYITVLGLDHIELKREYLESRRRVPTADEIAGVAESYDVSLSFHAPFRDWNMGSFNDEARKEGARRVKKTLDEAAEVGAGAVVVHGGSVPRRYPDDVQEIAKENARESLRECAEHAAEVGVPLCLENQPRSDEKVRHTTTPDDLAGIVESVDSVVEDNEMLKLTLDVGHARVNGFDWRDFAEEFGDRIHVLHLHDNDGDEDDHMPISEYDEVVERVGAEFNVFEMKEVDDIARCVGKVEAR
ncbi:MAG: sugar phosphate isomerase/epimerase family protein [Halobacteria archaeon]|nr:sugar phosphate isomerase/epimerase family protein [Halobacteria archaeon]